VGRERSAHFTKKRSKTWIGLAAFGAFAAAGLALVGAERPTPVQQGPRLPGSAPIAESSPVASIAVTLPAPSPGAPRFSIRKAPTEARVGAPRRPAEPEAGKARALLVATAHRELELLEVQEPTNFLAVFDMMREEEKWNEKTLEAGRRASHAYILARMRILEKMLRRFIDDPESDHAVESDVLAKLDADFKSTIDSLARDVPAMANIQELLTTTMLKAPTFADPSPEVD
jgi:hypothetical protein